MTNEDLTPHIAAERLRNSARARWAEQGDDDEIGHWLWRMATALDRRQETPIWRLKSGPRAASLTTTPDRRRAPWPQ